MQSNLVVQMHNQNQAADDVFTVLYCRPKTWCMIIGWLQMFGSVVFLVLETVGLLALTKVDEEAVRLRLPPHYLNISLLVTTIIIWLSQLICGAVLLMGVQQGSSVHDVSGSVNMTTCLLMTSNPMRNVGKVTVWVAFSVFFVPMTIVTAIWRLWADENTLFILDIILIPASLFSLWIVNIYRRQLLTSTAA